MSPEDAGASQPTAAPLPASRGTLTDALFAALRREPPWTDGSEAAASAVDTTDDDDLQLALYCCYELHYSGFPDVPAAWEWEPSLLAVRRRMEARVEAALRSMAGAVVVAPERVPDELRRLARSGDGPSLSAWLAAHGTRDHLVELAKHRSAYQLKEADPHTWAIPRLSGTAKAGLVAIQVEEYGEGVPGASHAALFAETMRSLDLATVPNAYLAELPAATLLTTNAMSLFGLHRRLRGALVGHLALFEMTSVGPMRRYAEVAQRLGLPPAARRFYEVHVEADQVHEDVAADILVASLLRREPELAGDVLFGARALEAVEASFGARLLGAWRAGGRALRPLARS